MYFSHLDVPKMRRQVVAPLTKLEGDDFTHVVVTLVSQCRISAKTWWI